MASLTGQQLKDTYDSLLKVDDNGSLGGTYKEITDGLGNGSNLYLGTGGRVGIGTNSPDFSLSVGNDSDSFNYVSVRTSNTGSAGYLFSDAQDVDVGYVNYSHVTNHMGFGANGTERLRIDSSGNVGIGATSVNAVGSKKTLHIDDSSGSAIRLSESSTNLAYLSYDSTDFFRLSSSDQISFLTSGSEHMRIDSSGNVGIGTTATPATLTGTSTESGIGFDGTSGFGVFVRNGSVPLYANRRGTDGDIISLRKDGTTVGSISVTGSSTSYNTSSDHRLKENVVPMEGALDKVAQLKPSRFNFIADTDRTVDGFLAHEVAEIVPNAVSGEKDAVDEEGNPMYQGIDHSKLVPILVGAIQELKAEIEQLKAQ